MTANMKLNIIDRIINYFSPLYAAKRIRARAILANAPFKNMTADLGVRVISRGIEMPDRDNHQIDDYSEHHNREDSIRTLPVYEQTEETIPSKYEEKFMTPVFPNPEGDNRKRFRPNKPGKPYPPDFMC